MLQENIGQITGWALDAGYILIDTAELYGNEQQIGDYLKEKGVKREDVFIVTKGLWKDQHEGVDVADALNASLEKLQLDYVDLYLMHYPVPERVESWKVMEKLYKEGKCKAIGVSNFTVKHLEEFLPHCEVVPAMNQVEFSPFLY